MATERRCSIEGCNRPHEGHGYCKLHRRRWRLHGDPLAQKWTRKGEPERFYREIVRTYEGDDCLIWPFSRDTGGYAQMPIEGKTGRVHRRICMETHGDPPTPKHQAAHQCGRGSSGCVAKRHLSWKTPSQNQMDKVRHGTSNRGENSAKAVLTEASVRRIRLLKGRLSQREIAKRFGIGSTTAWLVLNRKTWVDIEPAFMDADDRAASRADDEHQRRMEG